MFPVTPSTPIAPYHSQYSKSLPVLPVFTVTPSFPSHAHCSQCSQSLSVHPALQVTPSTLNHSQSLAVTPNTPSAPNHSQCSTASHSDAVSREERHAAVPWPPRRGLMMEGRGRETGSGGSEEGSDLFLAEAQWKSRCDCWTSEGLAHSLLLFL